MTKLNQFCYYLHLYLHLFCSKDINENGIHAVSMLCETSKKLEMAVLTIGADFHMLKHNHRRSVLLTMVRIFWRTLKVRFALGHTSEVIR